MASYLRKLSRSCEGGNLKVCQELIKQGEDINCRDHRGMTALMIAAENGRVQIVQLLVKEGANLDFTSEQMRSGYTALMIAVVEGHQEIVKLLIDAGADLNLTDIVGRTASMLAVKTGQTERLRMLMEAGAEIRGSRNPLFIAARGGHKEMTQMLINAGADITAKTRLGDTPLTIALSTNMFRVAQTLVGHGAGDEIKEDFGRKVLDVIVNHLARKH